AFSQKPSNEAIAIAASFTVQPLLPALQFVLCEAGLALNVRFAPYNQLFQELLSPTSLLATNTGGVDVVLVRLEDFVREIEDNEEALATIRRTTVELANALVHHSGRVKVPMVLAVIPPSPRVAKALPGIDAANEL